VDYYPSKPLRAAIADGRSPYSWGEILNELALTELQTPDITAPGRVRNHTPRLVVTTASNGYVLFVKDRDQTARNQGPSLILKEERRKGKRSHAGGNTCVPTTLDQLLVACRQAGLVVKPTARRHYAIEKDGRVLAHVGSTESDWRAVRNTVSALARAGVVLRRGH
jgi:hypothetical protein